jgi:hypothetical protein
MFQLGREEPMSRQAEKSLLLRRQIATIFCKKNHGRISRNRMGVARIPAQPNATSMSSIMTGTSRVYANRLCAL